MGAIPTINTVSAVDFAWEHYARYLAAASGGAEPVSFNWRTDWMRVARDAQSNKPGKNGPGWPLWSQVPGASACGIITASHVVLFDIGGVKARHDAGHRHLVPRDGWEIRVSKKAFRDTVSDMQFNPPAEPWLPFMAGRSALAVGSLYLNTNQSVTGAVFSDNTIETTIVPIAALREFSALALEAGLSTKALFDLCVPAACRPGVALSGVAVGTAPPKASELSPAMRTRVPELVIEAGITQALLGHYAAWQKAHA